MRESGRSLWSPRRPQSMMGVKMWGSALKGWVGWAVLIEWGGGSQGITFGGVNVFSVGVVDRWKSFWRAGWAELLK
jgi:hypothetical protein